MLRRAVLSRIGVDLNIPQQSQSNARRPPRRAEDWEVATHALVVRCPADPQPHIPMAPRETRCPNSRLS
jgi:hypothetical protein